MKYITLFFILLTYSAISFAEDINVRLSPNPASSAVQVEITGMAKGQITLEIFSVIGTKVLENTYTIDSEKAAIALNTAKIQDGVYLIKITQGDKISVKRLRIQHA